jgi:hypothetical protein
MSGDAIGRVWHDGFCASQKRSFHFGIVAGTHRRRISFSFTQKPCGLRGCGRIVTFEFFNGLSMGQAIDPSFVITRNRPLEEDRSRSGGSSRARRRQ